jgi:hypothetical protein
MNKPQSTDSPASFAYADYAVAAVVVALVAFFVLRHLRARSRSATSRALLAEDSSD